MKDFLRNINHFGISSNLLFVLFVVIFIFVGVPYNLAGEEVVSSRSMIDLDGIWQFHFTENDNVEEEKLYLSKEIFDRDIEVPVIWDKQGVKPSGKNKSRFIKRDAAIGVGWYRKEIELPRAWSGKNVWLHIGAAHRSVKVWVNGEFVGQEWGFSIAHRFNLTAYLRNNKPEQMLIIAVDSRQNRKDDPLNGAFSEASWGGDL